MENDPYELDTPLFRPSKARVVDTGELRASKHKVVIQSRPKESEEVTRTPKPHDYSAVPPPRLEWPTPKPSHSRRMTASSMPIGVALSIVGLEKSPSSIYELRAAYMARVIEFAPPTFDNVHHFQSLDKVYKLLENLI